MTTNKLDRYTLEASSSRRHRRSNVQAMTNEHGAECQDCKWFAHRRHANGRIDRKRYGACNYVVVWPEKVPLKYGSNWQEPRPNTAVWATSNAEGCPCFERPAP